MKAWSSLRASTKMGARVTVLHRALLSAAWIVSWRTPDMHAAAFADFGERREAVRYRNRLLRSRAGFP